MFMSIRDESYVFGSFLSAVYAIHMIMIFLKYVFLSCKKFKLIEVINSVTEIQSHDGRSLSYEKDDKIYTEFSL